LIIESHPEFKVTGEANAPEELFELLKHEKPDVLVIDLVVPQNKISQVIKIINEEYPELRCVLLIPGDLEPKILECMNNGVHGILRKESSAEQLVEAVASVAAGEAYIELPLSRMKSKIIQHIHNEHAEHINFTELTEREYEVLKLFAEGLTYKEIGNQLFISPRTVETHKNNILNKLELKSVADMIKYAIKHELINL
jgi:DNA-binding NarL/FixJ family response regulator